MPKFTNIFVTGGAGYIGSHSVVELLEAGYQVIACDNFTNSVNGEEGHAPSLQRVEEITGKKVIFYQCDLLDYARLDKIFTQHKIDCVIHFAAMKAVGESMEVPLLYYKNNVVGTINLLEVMKAHGCYQLVFSSSCCVYGNPDHLPITEEHPIGKVTNVYGRTKYLIEEMLMDLSRAEERWNIISLRYFNPVGAHPSGRIGEDPTKPFTNLMPYMSQVALGNKPSLTIFGDDYDTPDGTGVRDYIHVMDLAAGHVAALAKIEKDHLRYRVYNLGLGKGLSVLELIQIFEQTTGTKLAIVWAGRRVGDVDTLICDARLSNEELNWYPKYDVVRMCKLWPETGDEKNGRRLIKSLMRHGLTYNLGSGVGVSVLQLLRTFEKTTGKQVAHEIKPRRDGDICSMYSNGTRACEELGWTTRFTLEQMCEDFWRWQTMNPCGYRDAGASPSSPVKSKAAVNGTAEHSVNGSAVNGSAQPTAVNGNH